MLRTGQLTLYFSVLFLFNSTELFSQICEGNLGENIFIEGAFGSGNENILLPNPQNAPGYDYTINPPLWYSNFKGKQLVNNVFTYLVEIRFLDDEIVRYSGDISLVK